MSEYLFPEKHRQEQQLPLAVRMRPESLEEFVGQKHLLAPGKLLRRLIEADRLTSLILWGPPGVGKSSLGYLLSRKTGARFVYLDASFCGTSEIKKELASSQYYLENSGQRTILFIDEIHRLNRLQQDILITDTEFSKIILIGATTYNPFFYINPALISRSIVAEFKPLEKKDIVEILKRAVNDKERGLGGYPLRIEGKVLEFLAENASGDARKALLALEVGTLTTPVQKDGSICFDLEVARDSIQKSPAFYDKKADYHYDVISAFIKSIRGSDVDSALYWLARMLYSGEDPRFIARRLVILASEDIGNADPQALVLATACFKAVEFVGMPEAKIILSQVTIYLSQAPKSNASYLAIQSALQDVEDGEIEEVPLHLKDSHYKQAKKTGRGKDYKYPHNYGGFVSQKYRAKRKIYYFPKDIGKEKEIKSRLEDLRSQLGTI